MIPVKLTVRNFMPYTDNVPPLYFAGIHTASISGANGNGKSAIIDAMTWALWGKTRAKSDDDLIHLGRNEAEVEFDFDVGEQRYRVIRKRTRPKSARSAGQSSLDFFIAFGDDFRAISGNGIRETEDKIISTLHMDYDTFVNSAFLRQGHADEFTISSPAKRKKVLTDILALSYYDELEDSARQAARRQEVARAAAEHSIREIGEDLSRKPEYEAQLVQEQEQFSRLEAELAEQEKGLNELRRKKESLDAAGQQLAELEARLDKSSQDVLRWDAQAERHEKKVEEYQTLIERKAEIEEGYERLAQARKRNEELNVTFRKVSSVKESIQRYENEIDKAVHELNVQHEYIEKDMEKLEQSAQQLPELKQQRKQAQAEMEDLAAGEKELAAGRQAQQDLLLSARSLEGDIKRLESEISGLDERMDLLDNQTGAVCPLCRQELGEEHRRLIGENYRREKEQKTVELDAARKELAEKQAGLKKLSDEIPRLESALKQKTSELQNRMTRINHDISEAEKAASGLSEAQLRKSSIEELMLKKDYAVPQQQALAELETELSALDYDPTLHEEIAAKLKNYEKWESPKQRLDEAERGIETEKEAAAANRQAAAELRKNMESDGLRKEELSARLASLPQVSEELVKAEGENRELAARQRRAGESVGLIKGRLERIAELETRAREKEKELEQARKEEAIYRELALAFGQRGIQAWLIEAALPEIENEANRLLGRMTDNRMNVKIETQRETKSGDTVETLDIKIADELGTRNYEMYSGGEAFRINFAIRIALSKLLARRAGAPLPTLIIDEGFGTQDTAGLEKLKEAITSIQDDFRMILVITHIEDLRDAFPTRIDVVKTPDGSTIEVS